MNQPVNASLGIVAQGVDISIPFPVFKAIGCRVVLDDEIIPIRYPYGTIRPYLGSHRTEPVVGTRYHVPTIAFFFETSTYLLQDMAVYQPARRLRDECHPIPVFLWKRPCSI